MSETRRCLVLVDGSSYLYRAFHAMPSLTNSKGQPTGAAYGMTNMLKRLEAEVQPELAAVIFDAKGKTFRDDLYPEYKANRPPMPTELRTQLESIHAIVRGLGFTVLVEGGVEADDVIGTLAEQARQRGLDVLVCTGDKDMAQLVDDRVTMVNTMDDPVLDAAGVKAKFGVPPESIVDYLALVGDTVDNVPGVPKVGPKTASKWLGEYGTLENLVAHADEIKGKVGENLRASLAQIPLSKELVTILRDVELDVGPLDLELVEPDTEALKTLYGELEFRTWLGELLDAGGDAPAEAPAAEYETVLDEAALDAWIERLRRRGRDRVRHRDHEPRLHAGGPGRGVVRGRDRTCRLCAVRARLCGRTGAACAGAGAREAAPHPRIRAAGEDRPESQVRHERARPRRTSGLPASGSTPCWSRTCSTAPPPGTTWIRWP